MDTFIGTLSGRHVDLAAPDIDTIDIEDIATGLVNIPRFNGQARWHYSVLQHSLHVADLARDWLRDIGEKRPDLELAALLHDAAEAYIGDITPMVKMLCPQVKALEGKIQAAVEEALMPVPIGVADRRVIKTFDLAILATERKALHPYTGVEWKCLRGVKPALVKITYQNKDTVRTQFLKRYKALREAIDGSCPF